MSTCIEKNNKNHAQHKAKQYATFSAPAYHQFVHTTLPTCTRENMYKQEGFMSPTGIEIYKLKYMLMIRL